MTAILDYPDVAGVANRLLRRKQEWSEPKVHATKQGVYLEVTASPDPKTRAEILGAKKAYEKKGIFIARASAGWEITYHADAPKSIKDQYVNGKSMERLLWQPKMAINTKNLLPYQIPGVKRLIKALEIHQKACELSDGGTGKTYMSCAAARHYGVKILVICPTAVLDDWEEVAAFIGVEVAAIYSWEGVRSGNKPIYKYVTNSEGDTVGEFDVPLDTMIILDELHKGKGETSLNSEIVLAAARCKNLVIGATATLATGAHEMKASGELFGLHKGGTSYFKWKSDLGVTQGRYGSMCGDVKNHMQTIHEDLIPHHGNRIRIADLGDAFPKTDLKAEAFSAGNYTPEIVKAYDKMMQDIAQIENDERMTAQERSRSILVRILRARIKAERLKVPMFIDLMKGYLANGYSVALFLNFNTSINRVLSMLDTNSVIRGGQSRLQRRAVKEAFQGNITNKIVCNLRAGGVGLSLHDVHGDCPRVSLISPTWSAFDLKQTTFRVHRAGGTHSTQRVVFAANTIEENIMRKVQGKLNNLDSLNDGDLAITEKLYDGAIGSKLMLD